MPDLDFRILGVEAANYGIAPLLHFKLEVTNQPADEVIQSVMLQAQIQIHPTLRSYQPGEKEKLGELFGTPDRWGQTLRARLWTHANVNVPQFSGRTEAILSVPCTFDLNVSATKYFYALEDGEAPLLFLFSGTIFYQNADERLQIQQVSWNKESTYRLPVSEWKEMMDRHYPNTAWLSLQRDLFERLYAFRRREGLATWEATLERLLPPPNEIGIEAAEPTPGETEDAPGLATMNTALVEKVVNAVLYEGYILYPYRASSKKNRERFTFGRVYPEDYSIAQHGAEPSVMQTECLIRNESKDAVVMISLRFLHPMAREVGRLPAPIAEMSADATPDFEVVPDFRVGEQLYQTWQEVVEQKVEVPTFPLREAWQTAHHFEFPSSRALEPILGEDGKINAVLVRRQDSVRGAIEVTAQPIDETVFKVTVRVLNSTPVPPNELENQSAIIMRTFTSTHTILHAQGGEWLSLTDPPAAYAEAAAACKNIHTWPVLVGDPAKNERDAMLSSPIILYDYPQIAPESPGDLFDGLEIDEILTLRVMSDAEKIEMRQVDEQARKILERTENMSSDHLLKMHGVMRNARSSNENFFNPSTRLESATVGDKQVKAGDRVRIRPKKRADVMDMALAGKIGVIEAVEQDVDGGVQLALVLDDDPGRDLGMMRQPGHRFFYATDEVEVVKEDA